MKIKFLIIFVLASVIVLAQNYPNVSIRNIQFVPDSSLINGNGSSPRVGDTVRVTGAVVVRTVVDPIFNRKPIMWAGARYQSYIVDTNYNATEWSGLNIILNDTVNHSTYMDLLDTAQIVVVTGIVEEYTSVQTQLNILKTVPIQFLGTKNKRVNPTEVTIDQLNNGTNANLLTGEKYEGMYVIIRNVVSSDRNLSTGTFFINDANGNKMQIHDQSGYFTKRTHQLRTFDPPIDGSTITYIRGVIGHFSNPSAYVIRPMYPDDIFIGQSPPSISNIRRNTNIVNGNQPVTITATIQDFNVGDSVTLAQIKYRVNGGTLQTLSMTKGVNNVWSGTLPGVADSSLVDFYLLAKDANNNTGYNPVDTAKGKYFYLVLNRALKIQDIQYSPFGSGYSAYNNYRVTLSGIVTADTSDLQGDGNQVARRVYIQNGQGPWSGIWVYGLITDTLKRGQNITVSGLINENNNNTRIDSITQIVINSIGNPLPTPQVIQTSVISTANGGVLNGSVQAEQWESVLIRYNSLTVTNENADGNPGPNGGGNSNFGEIIVSDSLSGITTRIELQEGNHKYHNFWDSTVNKIPGNVRVKTGDKFQGLIGILFYSFGNYKSVPRKNDDFVGYKPVGVEPELISQPNGFSLSQNYPNPFNPTTVIEYSIPVSGLVQVKIFNVLGQEVKSLVNLEQSPGKYKVVFDAKELPSGIYMYQVNSGKYSITKKMMLLK